MVLSLPDYIVDGKEPCNAMQGQVGYLRLWNGFQAHGMVHEGLQERKPTDVNFQT